MQEVCGDEALPAVGAASVSSGVRLSVVQCMNANRCESAKSRNCVKRMHLVNVFHRTLQAHNAMSTDGSIRDAIEHPHRRLVRYSHRGFSLVLDCCSFSSKASKTGRK